MESARLTPRRPWYWVVVIAVVALAAIAAVYQNMRIRTNSNESQFAATQNLRLARTEQRVDSYFGDSEQLVRVGAQSSSGLIGNLRLTAWFAEQLFRARKTSDVYGLGVYFAPHAFLSNVRYVSVYDRAGVENDRHDRLLRGGVIQVLSYGTWSKDAAPYTESLWYKKAVHYADGTAWEGPYTFAGVSYISTLHTFRSGEHIAGVFSVDILTTHFKHLMRAELGSNDIMWLESGVTHQWLLGTAHLPADSATTRRDATLPLRYSFATLHISSDTSTLYADNRRVELISAILIAAILIVALTMVAFLRQHWEREEITNALQAEQERLEAEISVARRIETELRRAAYTDSLTGLPNRAAYMDRVRDLLASGVGGTVYLADLDRFNIVNETMGHLTGDGLLRVLAARLNAGLPKGTLVARLGGDEFVVVTPDASGETGVIAAQILELIGEPAILSGQVLQMRASVGIATLDATYGGPEEVLRDADIAMYQAKAGGRARYETFDTTMRARVARESELENDLRRGIDRGEFVAHYQPLIRIATREIASFEALVRWQNPNGNVWSAAEFVPFAETRGLMASLDAAVLRQVCAQSAAIGAIFRGASIAANISAAELGSANLPEYIADLLEEFKLPPNRLKLEITETAMMTQGSNADATIERLRALGIALILDDFGTGYSSLAYLQRLPIVGLKIDRSFIVPLGREDRALEIVRAIVALADALGLDTTAEGVETEEQLAILANLDVTFAQGWLFSKAVDLATLANLSTHPAMREA